MLWWGWIHVSWQTGGRNLAGTVSNTPWKWEWEEGGGSWKRQVGMILSEGYIKWSPAGITTACITTACSWRQCFPSEPISSSKKCHMECMAMYDLSISKCPYRYGKAAVKFEKKKSYISSWRVIVEFVLRCGLLIWSFKVVKFTQFRLLFNNNSLGRPQSSLKLSIHHYACLPVIRCWFEGGTIILYVR